MHLLHKLQSSSHRWKRAVRLKKFLKRFQDWSVPLRIHATSPLTPSSYSSQQWSLYRRAYSCYYKRRNVWDVFLLPLRDIEIKNLLASIERQITLCFLAIQGDHMALCLVPWTARRWEGPSLVSSGQVLERASWGIWNGDDISLSILSWGSTPIAPIHRSSLTWATGC